MASVTLATTTTLMHINMAVSTLLRSVRVHVHNMTFRTVHLRMTVLQGILSLRTVVELSQR